jgi:hypothetical protein
MLNPDAINPSACAVCYDANLCTKAVLLHAKQTQIGDRSESRPGRFARGRETQYPFYGKLGGLQGRDSISGLSSLQRVAIPNEVFRPLFL